MYLFPKHSVEFYSYPHDYILSLINFASRVMSFVTITLKLEVQRNKIKI